jgi:histidinol-phosphate/aromatic aminotransferase/cobyric acid decarboxylase-like protein/adenosyl cobinamide kinase/adenosyl cobinamide phosphate guanylyltransferase
MSLTVVIGGTRSGKSARAEALAHATGLPVRYVATAHPSDPEMEERIRRHAQRRPADWETVDAGASLAAAVQGAGCALVDGLGLWIATVPADAVPREIDALIAASANTEVIVVAEDVGSGLVPTDPETRAWVDTHGEALQQLSAAADRAELVIAGRAIPLPNTRHPTPDTPSALAALRHHGDTLVRPGDADHAVNVLAGGPPDWLREALLAALDDDATRYPRETDAVAALAALHGRDPEEVVPTNGAAEALWLLAPALRPTLAVCIHPGFTESEAALHTHGVPVARVLRDPDRGFALDPTQVPDAADLVIVGNPASPSGTLDPAPAILALRRPGRTVVVDEAFMDLVPGEPASLVRERLDDVIVVRSITKALAVPGLRAGYAVAGPALAARLRVARPPWSANALALAALAAAARRPEALAATAERVQEERADLDARLHAIDGLRAWPGAANFCLVEVPDGLRVTAALRDRAIAVRPAESFPGLGPGHLRITARTAAENARLASALEEAVAACR